MKCIAFRLSVIAMCIALTAITATAQTSTENLEKAVEEYNGLKEYYEGFTVKTLQSEHLNIIKTRMDKGISMLEKVINEGNAEQIIAARYFKNNLKYEYSFMLGMKGENAKALEIMKELEKDFTALTSNDFPIRYSYFGKNFIIKWENFAPTQAEFLTGASEVFFNMEKYDDAARLNRLAVKHPNTSDWLKYISINKMLDIHGKNSSTLTEAEHLDFALESMKAYDKLDDKNKETVKENNYPTTLRGSDILINKAKLDHSAAVIQRCAEAAIIAAKYEKSQSNALRLMEFCYRNQHSEIVEFHWVAVNLAKVMDGTDHDRALYVGTSALDQIAAKIGVNDCASMPKIAEGYRDFKLAVKASAMEERHRKCLAAALVEQQRQDEIRRKQEEANRKRQYRDEHPFNIYLGFNVLPIMVKPEKMDFGGHIDIRGRRVAHSFGYAIINKKNDLFSEQEDWDGTRAFYAMKIFAKSLRNQFAYSGIYFGYSDKEFMPILGQVNSKIDPTDFRQEIITPKDKQYDLIWNSGVQALGKGFGIDMWYGIGASYYQIDYGEIDLDQYAITGHEFFEKRSKKDAFSIIMRLGVSIGLNLGRKRG